MPSNCVCPYGICHHGRKKGKEKEPLCKDCIDLWFQEHLRHRIKKMLIPEGAESKCIVMRSLLQFLGLSSAYNPAAKDFQLKLEREYWIDTYMELTYEIRADNLEGKSFDSEALKEYKLNHREEAKLLARFHQGVHIHTAHLTWGANHKDSGVIWDIDKEDENDDVVKEVCNLLKSRVYDVVGRQVPWDRDYKGIDSSAGRIVA